VHRMIGVGGAREMKGKCRRVRAQTRRGDCGRKKRNRRYRGKAANPIKNRVRQLINHEKNKLNKAKIHSRGKIVRKRSRGNMARKM